MKKIILFPTRNNLMRHYEIILMIHPDQSDQVNNIIKKYTKKIEKSNGKIHRLEDWGRKQLSYSINKIHKAHYILLNIETTNKILDDIRSDIYYNNSIIRSMILRVKSAVKEISPMMKLKEEQYDKQDNIATNIKKKINNDTDTLSVQK